MARAGRCSVTSPISCLAVCSPLAGASTVPSSAVGRGGDRRGRTSSAFFPGVYARLDAGNAPIKCCHHRRNVNGRRCARRTVLLLSWILRAGCSICSRSASVSASDRPDSDRRWRDRELSEVRSAARLSSSAMTGGAGASTFQLLRKDEVSETFDACARNAGAPNGKLLLRAVVWRFSAARSTLWPHSW